MTVLETERLVLRPMETSDVDGLLTAFTDPLVLASFGMPSFERDLERWVRCNIDH